MVVAGLVLPVFAIIVTGWLAGWLGYISLADGLVIMPLVVYGLCVASGLNPLYTIAAVVCAAVPTAKTVFILAGEYRVEEELVAATVSITTLFSVATLLGWIYVLSGLLAHAS
jgi:malonate transporter